MMKTLPAALLSASLLLAACGSSNTAADPMKNPLFAEWYYKDLTESMMNLEIRNDPILKNVRIKEKAKSIRTDAQEKSQKAVAALAGGKMGMLMPVMDEAQGRIMLQGDMLYFGPDTNVRPGHDLHVYLSSMPDPVAAIGTGATVRFPDESAVDIGVMRAPYGISSFSVPQVPVGVRTVVLWDKTLKRMHAFAQLQ